MTSLVYILLAIVAVVIILAAVRYVCRKINAKVPKYGINQSLFVDINGTKQWINIYGKNKNNPVLLYLHGGPGTASSIYNYAFTRKWAEAYTVVTWDQRNCGKSYSKEQNSTRITCDLMVSDAVELTKFILDYLSKEKITLLGHSWGTYLGCRLAYEHPEYYDCYIGTGQFVDSYENEVAFLKAAEKWSQSCDEDKPLIERMNTVDFSLEYISARNKLMKKYGYDMFADGRDYSLFLAIAFNPYYSLADFYRSLKSDFSVYMDFMRSDEFRNLSLKGKTHYRIPFYNINGDKDYQTNYELAREYFEEVNAPYKELFVMKNTTHGLLESKSEEFSQLIRKIAEKQGVIN